MLLMGTFEFDPIHYLKENEECMTYIFKGGSDVLS